MFSRRRATRTWLLFRAQREICFFLAASATLSVVLLSRMHAGPLAAPKRPRILGIASVTILSTDIPAANDFYRKTILPESVCNLCERPPGRFFGLVTGQKVELREAPAGAANLLLEVSFLTEDLGKLRKFLEANGIKVEQGPYPG